MDTVNRGHQAGAAAQPKPITDLSANVVSLARMLDRLPPGNYQVLLLKPEYRGQPWRVEIVQTQTITARDLNPGS